jgi:hypothetical protein
VLRVADHVGARTVAIPAISTGAYGYPVHEAAAVAMLTVTTVATDVDLLRFVLLTEDAASEFERARAAAEARRAELDGEHDRGTATSGSAPAGLPPPGSPPDPLDGWVGGEILQVLDGFLDIF